MRWAFWSYIFISMLMTILAEKSILSRAQNEQVERAKRVSISDDVDFDHGEPPQPKSKSRVKAQALSASATNALYNFPVVLPAYGHDTTLKTAECMMYLENVTILILDYESIKNKHTAYGVTVGGKDKDTYVWDASYVNCPDYKKDPKKPVTKFSFTVDIKLADKAVANSSATGKGVFEVSGELKFTLIFNESFGINIINATIEQLNINVLDTSVITQTIDVTKAKPLNALSNSTNIRSYFQQNFACDSTQAIWFPNPTPGNDKRYHYLVGLVLNNVQIQSYNVSVANSTDLKMPYFSRLTTDCEPTFSPGSWMGLITTLVLVTVLMFGFLMLNSVQTMDRFDDPKQKQIVINFKE